MKQDRRLLKLTEKYFDHERLLKNLNEKAIEFTEGKISPGVYSKIKPESKATKPKPDVKKAWNRFINNISIHGLSRIPKSDLLLVKIVWSILIQVSSAYGIYTISNSIRDYLAYDVVSLNERIESRVTELPSLTVCIDPKFKIGLFDIMEICALNNVNCTLPNDVERLQIRLDQYGDLECIRYNAYLNGSLKLKTMTGTGYIAGFRSEFFFPTNVTLISFTSDCYLNSFSKVNPIIIGNSNAYSFQLTRSFDEKLEYPYNNCKKISDKTYRQQNCIEICKTDGVLKKFNCTIRGYYMKSDVDACPFEQVHFFTNSIEGCDNECPKECDQIIYTQRIKRQRVEDLKEGNPLASVVAMYYETPNYILTTQIPKMTGSTLLSDIGGALSLFIGLRFLNVVDIIEVLVDACYAPENIKR